MLVAISGTPGTGKSSVSNFLQRDGYTIFSLNDIAIENGFISGVDEKRDSKIIDIEGLNNHIKNKFLKNNLIFIEGHAAHLLRSMDYVLILRCHPEKLKKRLQKKGWTEKKINENVEAETIDVILCEAVEIHPENKIFEINTTNKKIELVAKSLIEIIDNKFKPTKKYNIGKIDWSEEILKDF